MTDGERLLHDTRGQFDGGRQFLPNMAITISVFVFLVVLYNSGVVGFDMMMAAVLVYFPFHMFQIPGIVAVEIRDLLLPGRS